jgi:hypothetical protein
MHPTAERVRELLHYDPETGVWTWKVNRHNRRLAGRVAGAVNSHGYRQITIDGVRHLASRLAFLWMERTWPPDQVDHRDMNPTNDRWANLRLASRSQNFGNQHAYSSNRLGVKGVSRVGKRYLAQIQKDGVKVYLGRFDRVEDAALAYRVAAEAAYGDFARII